MSEPQKPSDSKATAFADLAGLSVEHIAALAKFVQQAGGVENAQRAIESLEQLKKAA